MKYEVNSFIWVRTLSKKAKIRKINESTNSAQVSYWNTDNKLTIAEVNIVDIEPLRGKKQRDIVYFAKVKSSAIIPTKRDEDGCYDIYACFEEDEIVIKPNTISLIPTGIASCFSSKYRIQLRERGSTGTKGMSRRAGEIDSGYRGEWLYPINNTINKNIVIKKGIEKAQEYEDHIEYPYSKAIGQFAVEIVPLVDTQEIPYSELEKIPSQRGKGKLGASGK